MISMFRWGEGEVLWKKFLRWRNTITGLLACRDGLPLALTLRRQHKQQLCQREDTLQVPRCRRLHNSSSQSWSSVTCLIRMPHQSTLRRWTFPPSQTQPQSQNSTSPTSLEDIPPQTKKPKPLLDHLRLPNPYQARRALSVPPLFLMAAMAGSSSLQGSL